MVKELVKNAELKYLPWFTLKKLQEEQTVQEFYAVVLYLDIAGFTSLTASLMSHGVGGAEKLSDIINRLFTPVIDTIHCHHGFVNNFAGDALAAIFTCTETNKEEVKLRAIHAALEIIRIISNIETNIESSESVAVRLGLSYGRLQWGLLGDQKKTWYLKGDAIEKSVLLQAEAKTNTVNIDTSAYSALPGSNPEVFDSTQKNISLSITHFFDKELPPPLSVNTIADTKLVAPFIDYRLRENKAMAEFRYVISVFIAFKRFAAAEELNTFFIDIMNTAEEYQGYLSSVDFADKGNTMLFLFGMPVSYEDNNKRALDFSDALHRIYQDFIAIGIAGGHVYAGDVGSKTRAAYTAIGAGVNLASRLMSKAEWGQTLVHLEDFEYKAYVTQNLGNHELKGFNEKKEIIQLSGKKEEETIIKYHDQFRGRETECSLIENYLSLTSKTTNKKALYVVGAPGSGKTRLVIEAIKNFSSEKRSIPDLIYLKADGILRKSLNIFTTWFHQFFKEFDLNPNENSQYEIRLKEYITKKLNPFLQKAGDNKAAAENMHRNLLEKSSVLASTIGLYWPGSLFDRLDPQAKSENVEEIIKEFFEFTSFANQQVMFIDDAHVLDEDSMRVLSRIIQSEVRTKPDIIFAGRLQDNQELPDLPGIQTTEKNILRLKGLSIKETREKITEMLGAYPDDKLVDFIFARSSAIPFFIEQLLMYMLEKQLLTHNGQSWQMKNEQIEVPGKLQSLLISRIDRLSQPMRQVLRLASVMGTNFDAEVLGQILGSNYDLAQYLQRGESQNLWIPESESRYFFQSDMLQQAAYEMMLPQERKEKHNAISQSLVELYGNNAVYYADIAYHAAKAENTPMAKEYYYKAAEFAKNNYKNEKALQFYHQLLNYSSEIAETLKINLAMIDIYEVTGDYQLGIDKASKTLAQAEEQNLDEICIKTAIKIIALQQKAGGYPEALQAADKALSIYYKNDFNKPILEAEAILLKGRTLWSRGKYRDSIDELKHATELYRAAGNAHGEALSLYYTGVNFRDLSSYDEAMQYYRASRELFERENDLRYVTYPVYDIAVLYQYRAELEKARKNFESVLKKYHEIGYRSGISATLLNLGLIKMRTTSLEAARHDLQEALFIAREIGENMAIAYNLYALTMVSFYDGNYPRALNYAEDSLKLMVKTGTVGYYGYVFSYLTLVYALTGKVGMALKTAIKHFENIKETGSDVEHGLTKAGVGIALAKIKDASLHERLTRRLRRLEQLSSIKPQPQSWFESALNDSEKSDYYATFLPASRWYAGFLKDSGDKEKAKKVLNKALDIARRTNYTLERLSIEKVLEQL